MTVTKTIGDHDYTVDIDTDGSLSISQDGHWAGSGRWNGRAIEDCAAHLGSGDNDESLAIYDNLDDAISAALQRA